MITAALIGSGCFGAPDDFTSMIKDRMKDSLRKAEASFLSGNYKDSLRRFEDLRKIGFSGASQMTALMHYHGIGTGKDLDLALDHAKKPSEQGMPFALYIMGQTSRDPLIRFEYLKRIFDSGTKWTGAELGRYYENDEIFPRDYDLAIEYHTAAFEEGRAVSAMQIGKLYFKKSIEDGWNQGDLAIAKNWGHIAFANGDPEAAILLSGILFQEKGQYYDFLEGCAYGFFAASDDFEPAKKEGSRIARDCQDIAERKMIRSIRTRSIEIARKFPTNSPNNYNGIMKGVLRFWYRILDDSVDEDLEFLDSMSPDSMELLIQRFHENR